jgi:hypothetical protein
VIVGFYSFGSLDHQHRVLHQSSLPYLSEDRESTSYQKTPTPAQAPGSTGRPALAPRFADRGRLTHLTKEEARDALDVVTGEYLINGS